MGLRSQGCGQCSDKAPTVNPRNVMSHESVIHLNSNDRATQPHYPSIVNRSELRLKPASDSNCEVVVMNFIKDPEFDHKLTALTVLKAVLPSITAEDVVCCRLAVRKNRGSSDITSTTRPLHSSLA